MGLLNMLFIDFFRAKAPDFITEMKISLIVQNISSTLFALSKPVMKAGLSYFKSSHSVIPGSSGYEQKSFKLSSIVKIYYYVLIDRF